MQIEFFLTESSVHPIYRWQQPVVPRKGEYVILREFEGEVESVKYDYTDKLSSAPFVKIYLRVKKINGKTS